MKLPIGALGVLLLASAPAYAAGSATPNLRCETGPVNRKFGNTDWLVYSCDDGRSMVVVSADKNPATPFYFVLTPDAGGYRVTGEGSGNKQASDAGGDDLSRMGAAEFADLLAATRAGHERQP